MKTNISDTYKIFVSRIQLPLEHNDTGGAESRSTGQ